MGKSSSLSIIVPALNEGHNLERVLSDLIRVLSQAGLDWEIIVVDDGSSDDTTLILERMASGETRIKTLRHQRPVGVGACFLDGVRVAGKECVTWLPADGENDPREILKYLPLMEHVDMVIPFVVNKQVRPLHRRILSVVYLWIINLSFRTKFNYTNGNIIYRRAIFEVVKPRSRGFLFSAECLVKAMRSGFIFAEVPVILKKRFKGDSKALLLKSFFCVCREFVTLFMEMQVLRGLVRGKSTPTAYTKPNKIKSEQSVEN